MERPHRRDRQRHRQTRFENGDIILEIDTSRRCCRARTIRAESYVVNRPHPGSQSDQRSAKGPQVVLSRTDPALLIAVRAGSAEFATAP
jgi:hypothetical protein